jgi:hypothetical protein
MRLVILAISTALLASAATSSMAATSRKSSASGSYASVRSYESCEELGRSRGFTRFNRRGGPGKLFIARCMQGKQH